MSRNRSCLWSLHRFPSVLARWPTNFSATFRERASFFQSGKFEPQSIRLLCDVNTLSSHTTDHLSLFPPAIGRSGKHPETLPGRGHSTAWEWSGARRTHAAVTQSILPRLHHVRSGSRPTQLPASSPSMSCVSKLSGHATQSLYAAEPRVALLVLLACNKRSVVQGLS